MILDNDWCYYWFASQYNLTYYFFYVVCDCLTFFSDWYFFFFFLSEVTHSKSDYVTPVTSPSPGFFFFNHNRFFSSYCEKTHKEKIFFWNLQPILSEGLRKKNYSCWEFPFWLKGYQKKKKNLYCNIIQWDYVILLCH